jgi:hypothetical protein
LLGARLTVARSDHHRTGGRAPASCSTPIGLVERRDTGLDEGVAELVDMLTGQEKLNAKQVCELVLKHFGFVTEDGIVLAVIHAHPERGPRPAEAGPEALPGDLTPDTLID